MLEEIYRIQDKDGNGPYYQMSGHHSGQIRDELKKILGEHSSSNGHPTAFNEFLRCSKKEEKFGFFSMDQLTLWFSNQEIKALEHLGFNIHIVYGKITELGEKQVLFIPDENLKPKIVKI